MITAFLAGSTIALGVKGILLWFDKIELKSEIRQLEFQVEVLRESVDKLVKEYKNGFTPGIN